MSPRFHADHVGSLLRPAALHSAFKDHRIGAIDRSAFVAVQDQAIRDAVAMQEDVGLNSVTDGEFRRASYWSHFVDAVDGLTVEPALFEFTDEHGGRVAFQAPQVTDRLRRNESISGSDFDFLRSITSQTPKITLPSPSTMHFWRGSLGIAAGAYSDPQEMFADLVDVYRAELDDLVNRGAKYVQLDEVPLAMLCDPRVRDAVTARGDDPDELIDLYIAAINQVLSHRPLDVTASMHLCRGNYKGNWLAAGGYEPIAERLFSCHAVDTFFLEFDTDRSGSFSPLRYVSPKTGIVLGLISSKTPYTEKRDDVMRQIEMATQFVSIERLGLSPQCGFASTVAGNPLVEADQRRKLALIVDIADSVWGTR